MNTTKVSKYLALILRHKPEVAGISLDAHGWADVKDLINGISRTYQFDIEMLEEIVKTDNKQRYSFNKDKTKIRANQGHSVNVDVELEEAEPPEFLYHGTADKYVDSIRESGIMKKSRLYVHLSADHDTAVMVGKRHGKPVVFCVKSGCMYVDGYKFFKSKNGTWLTDFVPVKYLEG